MQHHNSAPTSLSLSAKDGYEYLQKYCNTTPVPPTLPATCIQIHFPCSDRLIDYLRTQAKSSKDIRHHDVYYDGFTYTLVTNNSWLRLRDQEKFEMKDKKSHGINENSPTEGCICFNELTDEQAILTKVKQMLNYEEPERRRSKEPLTPIDVAQMAFAHFPFIRNEFDTDYGTIYVDEMSLSDDCNDFYVLGTIKIYSIKDIARALAFLRVMELDSGPMRSKVIEWIHCKRPDVYKLFVDRKIVKDSPYQSTIGHYTSPPITTDLHWFKNYGEIMEFGEDTDSSC